MTRRITSTDVLFDICYRKWLDAEVRIKKELRPPPGNDALGTFEETDDGYLCTLYPHDPERHPPVEQTLLHEMIHLGLDLEGEWDRRLLDKEYKETKKKGTTYWLEKWMWRRLTSQQKAILTEMVEGEMK